MAENEIINQNADEQEARPVADEATADVPTATTNAPVENPAAGEEPVIPATQPAETAFATPHDDFDWSIDKRNVSTYKKEEREKYDSVYDNTFVQINDGEIINGNVVALTKTDVVVNIGFKSDGLVSLNEFRDLPNLAVQIVIH